MEDKELQELFAAKRTTEANRRRQEELRRALDAAATPKSRRLWPVWALSAAASIALLLIALPVLFRSETAEPVLVAEAKKPVAVEPTKPEVLQTPKAIETKKTTETIKNIKNREAVKTIKTVAPEPATEIASSEEPVLMEATKPVETEEKEETIDNGPRIHRRTSTQMVCSNCNINNVPSPRYDFQQFLADAFGTGSCAPITLKSIEF